MEPKPIYQSKTAWVSLIVAVAAFFPTVQHFIVAQPELYGSILGGVFLVLRLVTKGKVDIA
jgi:hypothetical protein